jgi:hypothetical protein
MINKFYNGLLSREIGFVNVLALASRKSVAMEVVKMPGSDMSHEAVKSICDKLECSPQSSFTDSPYGGKPNIVPKNVEGHAQAKGISGTLGMKSMKSSKVPGYKGKFSKRAQQA